MFTAPYLSDFFTRIVGVDGSGKSLWAVVSFSFNNMLLGVTGGKYKDIRLGPASSRVDKKPAVADGQMARYYWPGQRGHIARICYPRRRLIFYPFATSWFVATRYFSLSWFVRPPMEISLLFIFSAVEVCSLMKIDSSKRSFKAVCKSISK